MPIEAHRGKFLAHLIELCQEDTFRPKRHHSVACGNNISTAKHPQYFDRRSDRREVKAWTNRTLTVDFAFSNTPPMLEPSAIPEQNEIALDLGRGPDFPISACLCPTML